MQVFRLNDIASGDAFRSNSYILMNGDSFAILDPSHTLAEVREVVGDFVLDSTGETVTSAGVVDNYRAKIRLPRLLFVIATHCHYDHIREMNEYLAHKVSFVMSAKCRQNLLAIEINGTKQFTANPRGFPIPDDLYIDVGEKIALGDHTLCVQPTPGHTDCSISVYDAEHLFCGDLIFAGGIFGRYDLPTGDRKVQIESIRWVRGADENLLVHSGHGAEFYLRDWRKRG